MAFRARLEFSFPKEVLSDRRVSGKILAHMQETARNLKRDMEATAETWDFHDVSPETDFGFAGGEAFAEVTTDEVIWHFLDEGTSHRWAIMDSDWVSKTSPDNPLNPGRGRGSVLTAGRSRMKYPRPGIEARNFTEAIIENNQQEFEDGLSDIIE